MASDIAISAALRRHVRQLALDLKGRPALALRRDTEWRYGTKGSVSVLVAGEGQGQWYDHEARTGGGPLGLIRHVLGTDQQGALHYALTWLGTVQPLPRATPSHASRSTSRDARIRRSADLWRAAQTAIPLPALRYLASRAIAYDRLDLDARWTTTWCDDRRDDHGALVLPIRRLDGSLAGTQRLFIDPDGTRPAIAVPKRSRGAATEGAVWLGSPDELPADQPLLVAEGFENAASVKTVFSDHLVAAALSTAGLVRFQPPADCTRVVIVADHDRPNAHGVSPGFEAAHILAHRLTVEGYRVEIALPPTAGTDANDLLRAGGHAAIRALIAQATAYRLPIERHGLPAWTLPGTADPDLLTVHEARYRLSRLIDGFVADVTNGKTPRLAIRAPAGLGKSRAAVQALSRHPALRAGYLVPNHRLGAAVVQDLEAAGLHAQQIFGKTQVIAQEPLCTRLAVTERAREVGLGAESWHLCKRRDSDGNERTCPHYADCPWQNQVDDAARVYVMTHDVLRTGGHPALPALDLLIVDEKFLRRLMTHEYVPYGHLPGARDPAARIAGLRLEEALRAGTDPACALAAAGITAEQVRGFAEAERRAMPSLEPDDPDSHILDTLSGDHAWRPAASRLWEQLARALDRLAADPGALCHGIHRTTQTIHAADGKPRVLEDIAADRLDRLHSSLAEIPVLAIDADLEPDLITRALGDIEIVSLATPRHARVHQVIDRTLPRSSFMPGADGRLGPRARTRLDETRRLIDTLATEHPRLLVVASKAVEEELRADWQPPDNVATDHFGAIQGTNAYAGYDAVVIVGREQPDLRAIDRMLRACHAEDGKARPTWASAGAAAQGLGAPLSRPIRLSDGSAVAIRTTVHPDPLGQLLLEQARERESLQAVDRLRLLDRPAPADVYLLSSVPLDMPVDQLWRWNADVAGRLPAVPALIAQSAAAWTRQEPAATGVVPLSAAWLMANARRPDGAGPRFGSIAAVRGHLRDHRVTTQDKGVNAERILHIPGLAPYLAVLSYRLRGQRGRASHALAHLDRAPATDRDRRPADPSLVADLTARLERTLSATVASVRVEQILATGAGRAFRPLSGRRRAVAVPPPRTAPLPTRQPLAIPPESRANDPPRRFLH